MHQLRYYINRVKVLCINNISFLPQLFPVDACTYAPLLRRLVLSDGRSGNIENRVGRLIAPNLLQLEKAVLIPLSMLIKHSPRLVQFQDVYYSYGAQELHDLLFNHRNLITCVIRYCESPRNRLSRPPSHTIVLNHLTSFSVFWDSRFPLNEFRVVLSQIEAPNIHELYFSEDRHLEDFDGDIITILASWLSRFRNRLDILTVASAGIPEVDLEAFQTLLNAVPGLVHLCFKGYLINDATIHILDLELHPSLCPILQGLEFINVRMGTVESLAHMVISRSRPPDRNEDSDPFVLTLKSIIWDHWAFYLLDDSDPDPRYELKKLESQWNFKLV
ncbi:hypothetical protein M422DRAFT_68363 [Sphaerobolus stellatus SS14]|uniref:F-box domain-containing protein n=1 Tax=Sphaerobolus stellatus (strain SS14) TaxID=990650 RepID=A0A0C9VI00_SPHS4|nr:hypothetical protein M422DRAFT_68363 [Sphaerobolus stellatus SS14]